MIAELMGGIPVVAERSASADGSGRQRYIPDITRLAEIYKPLTDFRAGIGRTLMSLRERSLIKGVLTLAGRNVSDTQSTGLQ